MKQIKYPIGTVGYYKYNMYNETFKNLEELKCECIILEVKKGYYEICFILNGVFCTGQLAFKNFIKDDVCIMK